MSESITRRAADAVVVVALLPLLLLPQMVGGVHPSSALAFAVVELIALSAWIALSHVDKRPVMVSWLVLPFLLGALFTAVEVLPLPAAILEVLVPAPQAMRAFVVAGLPAELQAHVLSVISMDPPETKAALLRLLGATAMFVVVSNGARRRQRARIIWRAIIVAAAALFVVALGHALLELPAWGTFRRSSGIFFAPIVNANHQSKVFAAFSFLCLGRALSCRERVEAVVAGVVGILCGIAVALTLSRGGMLAWCAGAVIGAVLVWRSRGGGDVAGGGDEGIGHHLALPGMVVALVLVLVGALAIADRAVFDEVKSLQTDSSRVETSKIALWAPALGLLNEHVVGGVGNNAFAVAFSARSVPKTMYDAELTFSHVEMIVVGTLVEHGAVVGGLLVLLSMFIGLRLLQQLRTRAEIAAVPAVLVLVIGDIFDFALESGAGIATMATALALCAAALPKSDRRLRTAPAIAAVVVAVGLVAAHAPGALRDWRYRFDRQLKEATIAQRLPLLQRSLAARPFDGYTCTVLAVDARQRRQPREALQWANRAINLWPTLPEAHIEAARALAAQGRVEQAMLEYREAAMGSPSSEGFIREAFSRTPDAAIRRRALPDTATALATLCSTFLAEKRLDDAAACAVDLAARADATPAQRLEPVRQALARGDDAGLRTAVPALTAMATENGASAALLAQVLARLDGDDEALDKSSRLLTPTTTATPELLQWRLNTQAKLGRFDDAVATIAVLRLVQRTIGDHDGLDRQEAALQGRAGNHGQRLIVLQRLAARHPDDVNVLAEVGLTEVAMGRETAALQTWRRVRDLNKTTTTTTALEKALGLNEP